MVAAFRAAKSGRRRVALTAALVLVVVRAEPDDGLPHAGLLTGHPPHHLDQRLGIPPACRRGYGVEVGSDVSVHDRQTTSAAIRNDVGSSALGLLVSSCGVPSCNLAHQWSLRVRQNLVAPQVVQPGAGGRLSGNHRLAGLASGAKDP